MLLYSAIKHHLFYNSDILDTLDRLSFKHGTPQAKYTNI